MAFVKIQSESDSNGKIEAIYEGLKKNTDSNTQWYSVESELLEATGELYLLAEAETPTDGWDKSDQKIGVIVETMEKTE